MTTRRLSKTREQTPRDVRSIDEHREPDNLLSNVLDDPRFVECDTWVSHYSTIPPAA